MNVENKESAICKHCKDPIRRATEKEMGEAKLSEPDWIHSCGFWTCGDECLEAEPLELAGESGAPAPTQLTPTEDRTRWIASLNEALGSLRAWANKAETEKLVLLERLSCADQKLMELGWLRKNSGGYELVGAPAPVQDSPTKREHSAMECTMRTCAHHRDLWRHYEDDIAGNKELRDATWGAACAKNCAEGEK